MTALTSQTVKDLEIATTSKQAATELKNLATVATSAVQSTAAGVKVVGGEIALDGSNPTPVVTGLTTITGASITLKDSAAPGAEPTTFSYTSSGGTLSIYAWKPTAAGDTALVASTATDTVGWIATGT
jgi:hypothetical protein